MNTLENIFKKKLIKVLENASEYMSEADLDSLAVSFAADYAHNTVPQIAEDIVKSLKESSEDRLQAIREYADGFVDRNIKRWKNGFDALELLINVSLEIGEEFNNTYRETAVQEQNVQFDTLVRLHARACHIGSEILWLLKGGFADGAHARWRALHEVVVTAKFLLDHGHEVAIRYREHEVIESYKAMQQINKYEPRLKIKGYSEEELKACEELRDKVIHKYGVSFKGSYGWAAEALDMKNPKFFHLEEAVKLDHFRPYYKWASQNIHANVHGIINKLGLVETEVDTLLAGASNSGMTDPADLTSLSLTSITVGLLTIYPNMDSLVSQHVIKKIGMDIGEIFLKVESEDSPSEFVPE